MTKFDLSRSYRARLFSLEQRVANLELERSELVEMLQALSNDFQNLAQLIGQMASDQQASEQSNATRLVEHALRQAESNPAKRG